VPERVGSAGLLLAFVVLTSCTPTSPRASSASSPPLVAHPPAGPVVAATVRISTIARENDRPGTTSWRLDAGRPGTIEGFAFAASVAAGSPITFAVRSRAPYSGRVYRLGWYHGMGGRLVATLPQMRAQPQPDCPIGPPPRHMVVCSWRPAFSISTAPSWVSGAYLVKLASADGSQAYVPFVVRERIARAPVVVQLSVTTWQAYNSWGGTSLYARVGAGPRHAGAQRARAVSFERPYVWPGSGQLFDFEYPLIFWLESHGIDAAYATDIDLDLGTAGLPARRVFIAAGHDEYYSTAMRRALEAARARGTDLVFLGANDVFRHIRLEDGDGVEVNYKYASEDPLRRSSPLQTTGSWRDPPLNQPEQSLLGEQSVECPRRILPWAPTGRPTWLFAGTGLGPGAIIPSLVGYEYDGIFPIDVVPSHLIVVARTYTGCAANFAGGRGDLAETTLYAASSGALVFDAGSVWFDCALGPGCDDPWLRMPRDPAVRFHPRIRPDPRVQRLILNLLGTMLAPAPRARTSLEQM